MNLLRQDIRYALRRLGKAPWFTLAAVITLALGIGANTAVFTLVNAVLLRGLPFEESDRLVAVWMENNRGQQSSLSYPDLADIAERSSSLAGLGGYLGSSVNVSDDESLPEQVSGAYITGNFFGLLGEQPTLGRGIGPEDDVPGATPVVLISHSLWQSRFGGDPGILGRVIRVNSLPATIVGVMAQGMGFPNNNDIWIPKSNLPPETQVENRATGNFGGIGRLAPGVSIERAREELQAIGQGLAEAYPETNAERQPGLMSYQERVNGTEIRVMFLSLMGAVAFVLLIACANVGNLLLAKSSQRSREIAVRVSLGATRGRIVRQLLIESLFLALLAGVVGLGLAVLGIRWFDANTQDVGKPYWMEFTLDPAVFAFMAAVCLGTVALFGLAPALNVSKTDVNEVLKEGGRGGSGGRRARRWTSALVVGELILTLVLLSGAMFMMRSFLKLYTMDVGFDTERLLTMRLYLPLTQYPQPGPRGVLFDNLERRLSETPGIESSALATAVPLSGGGGVRVEMEGGDFVEPELRPVVTSLTVGSGYFETLGIPLVQGRAFGANDGEAGYETVVVNQRFADLHFSGDPIGRRIRFGSGPDGEVPWRTVIGVSPNIRQTSAADVEPDPVMYMPLRSNPARAMALLVRARGDAASATGEVREAVRAVDPDLPVFSIMSFDEALAAQRWPFRIFGLLFSVFASIALVLSGVGLYSITAYSVIQRTQEFGIRMSLGATPAGIATLALRRGLMHLAIGLPVGLLGALGVGRLLQSMLAQVSPSDPVTLAGIVVMLGAIAVLACLAPARRAARLDPVVALRTE